MNTKGMMIECMPITRPKMKLHAVLDELMHTWRCIHLHVCGGLGTKLGLMFC